MDHPRPQLRRTDWLNLDGAWDAMLDDEARYNEPAEVPFDRTITVPYPPDAKASGVNVDLAGILRLEADASGGGGLRGTFPLFPGQLDCLLDVAFANGADRQNLLDDQALRDDRLELIEEHIDGIDFVIRVALDESFGDRRDVAELRHLEDSDVLAGDPGAGPRPVRRVLDADEVIGEEAEVEHLGVRPVVHDLGGDLVARALDPPHARLVWPVLQP